MRPAQAACGLQNALLRLSCQCTYEPLGTWFRGSSFINSPTNWPCAPANALVRHALSTLTRVDLRRRYCMPQLAQVYATCDFVAKQLDSCNIQTLAANLNITLPRQMGNTLAEINALPPWSSQQRSG